MVRLIILITILGLSRPALPQDKNNLIEKIVELKTQKLIDKFQLTGNAAEEFSNLIKNHTYTTARLSKKRRGIIKQMNDNYEKAEALEVLLKELIDTEDSLYNARKNFIGDLRNILSPAQIAKMIIEEKKFNNELREKIRELRKKRKEKRSKD